MKRGDKVVWGEGMFLTPHLFQQADRYHEQILDFRLRSQAPFCWGVVELSLNRSTSGNFQNSLPFAGSSDTTPCCVRKITCAAGRPMVMGDE